MLRKILPYVVLFTALALSGSAALYSVIGLSSIFAGAATTVLIMAGIMEFGKIITAVLLHNYWNELNISLRFYLTTATIILMLITSAGIYGLLSAAYQETAYKENITDRKIELIDAKVQRFNESKEDYKIEKETVSQNISDLRKGLSNPGQVQYIDRETGEKITTTSSSTRRSLENQLDQAISTRNKITDDLQFFTDTIGKLEIEKIEIQNSSESSSELLPLKYISNLTGYEMDIIVNIFTLLLIFVFDPLAIALIITASFLFNRPIQPKKEEIIEESEDIDMKKINKEVASEYRDAQKSDSENQKDSEIFYEDIDKLISELDEDKSKKKEEPKRKLLKEQIKNMSHQEVKDFYNKQK